MNDQGHAVGAAQLQECFRLRMTPRRVSSLIKVLQQAGATDQGLRGNIQQIRARPVCNRVEAAACE